MRQWKEKWKTANLVKFFLLIPVEHSEEKNIVMVFKFKTLKNICHLRALSVSFKIGRKNKCAMKICDSFLSSHDEYTFVSKNLYFHYISHWTKWINEPVPDQVCRTSQRQVSPPERKIRSVWPTRPYSDHIQTCSNRQLALLKSKISTLR